MVFFVDKSDKGGIRRIDNMSLCVWLELVLTQRAIRKQEKIAYFLDIRLKKLEDGINYPS